MNEMDFESWLWIRKEEKSGIKLQKIWRQEEFKYFLNFSQI